ncbi:MAG: ABC transporter ATP-binding protein [Candidatus Thiodiazotropha sp. (ex Lucinoma borealis)]|nr:ABC transporter ATP-binding protein [Candidatus Thiodiazotropha sp. (ex Lucinoma borealis)]MCU7858114.1 ABC transporter ATP-binding protein [Candidatus Thiodiazotropha sp. (ex Lucinoma borealis)]MCU7868537.1 ABC transporter ATP-binding protein [Candidatus Thiodiazotropha sp. (ex Lucinoma borealis)]
MTNTQIKTIPMTNETASGRGGEITLSNVGKIYGSGPFAKDVVKNCSFTIEKNKLTVMIGPSGCGKSTLIQMIAGFESPTTGSIVMNDKPITGPGKDRLVLFQESALFPWMTTYENILYGPNARGENTKKANNAAQKLLEKVGLTAFRDKYPTQLSGGMQRRAELARAMINKPEIMILDEPFRGLDCMSKELMWEYYAGLYEESRDTNFFITTDIDEAIFLADRLLIMTNLPTSTRAVLEVDIPRPRKIDDLGNNKRANEIKIEVMKLLHDEAMKSFSGGSKAAADFLDAYSKRTS